MTPLAENQIRSSFVNASRREVANAALPDLGSIRWDRLEYLGWRDRKAALVAYVVLEHDGAPVGVRLRAADHSGGRTRRRTMCAWCEDVVVTEDVTLYAARRTGSAGRRGDSIGTLICTEFRCSANVRRPPTSMEAGTRAESVREEMVARRIAGLLERTERFAGEILRTA